MKAAILALIGSSALAHGTYSYAAKPAVYKSCDYDSCDYGYKSYSKPAYSYGYAAKPAYRSCDYDSCDYGYKSYSKPAYGYGYSAKPAYGYQAKSYDGYGYRASAYRKDYGVWEKYYRIEVESFEKTVVTDTENVWVIAFIDPACGYCQRFSYEWERLTTVETTRATRVRYGYIDVSEESSQTIVQRYTSARYIESTPSLYIYGRDKYHPVAYRGEYVYDSVHSWVETYCNQYGYAARSYSSYSGYDHYGRGYKKPSERSYGYG